MLSVVGLHWNQRTKRNGPKGKEERKEESILHITHADKINYEYEFMSVNHAFPLLLVVA